MTQTFTIPEIETERLLLRGWLPADLEPFTAQWKHTDWNQYLGGFRNRHEVWDSMASANGSWSLQGFGFMAITLRKTGELIGMGGPLCPGGWPEPEIGWSIFTQHQRMGYATEAGRAALNFVYKQLGWTTAISLIDVRNEASIAVAKKMGAKLERHSVVINHFVADVWRHLSPPEFLEQNS